MILKLSNMRAYSWSNKKPPKALQIKIRNYKFFYCINNMNGDEYNDDSDIDDEENPMDAD